MPSMNAAPLSTMDDFSNFNDNITSSVLPRWKRKELERERFGGSKTPSASNRSTSRTAKTPKSGAKSAKRSKTPSADRFIPNRSMMDFDMCRMQIAFDDAKENGNKMNRSSSKASDLINDSSAPGDSLLNHPISYDVALHSSILSSSSSSASLDPNYNDLPGTKILAFKEKAPVAKEGSLNPNRVLYSQNAMGAGIRRNRYRHIPTQPEKVLDAPNLLEDYYLNLIDWGCNGTLAVALADTVYLWNAQTGAIEQLCQTSGFDDCITSVSWGPNGRHLAVGTNSHQVQIWDAEKMSLTRVMTSHSGRVGSLAWNNSILTSGSRDGNIHNHDVRIADHHVATLATHTQEVCGLKWSPNGTQLASGGNDNLVCIWENQHAGDTWSPRFKLNEHTAAVKALAWCPWQQNVLATGGGTADRYLRFWNTMNGACLNSIDTKSQVCAIQWNPHDKELVTSHGFSQNQLTVWKYPSLQRMAELKGHESRVLHLALSPDGQTVVSGAADETLRFWRIFDANSTARGTRAGHGKGSLHSCTDGPTLRPQIR